MLENLKFQNIITFLYFALGILLFYSVVVGWNELYTAIKPSIIPMLTVLYIATSQKRDYLFVIALFLVLCSNIFLLLDKSYFTYAVVAFLLHRIFIIGLVIRYTTKIHLTAFVIAIVPFLFLFVYLFEITDSVSEIGFYTALINTLVMSILAAIALSNFIFEENRRNSWLLISSLLFVISVFIFVIEKFYISHPIFKPITSLIFVIGHYGFYRYIVLSEHECTKLLSSEIDAERSFL